MKTSITFGAAILVLAAGATSCATVAGNAGSGSVYLVGVAGGG